MSTARSDLLLLTPESPAPGVTHRNIVLNLLSERGERMKALSMSLGQDLALPWNKELPDRGQGNEFHLASISSSSKKKFFFLLITPTLQGCYEDSRQ